MINLTRINRVPLVLNSDLIEYIEKTPDTVISLTNGLKLLVLESPDEIVGRVVTFRRQILDGVLDHYPGLFDKSTLDKPLYPFPATQRVVSAASKTSKKEME
jgi:flagellar protein FlbD